MAQSWDVIVIGGGHAGTEAAAAAARFGARTLLVTHRCETIGEMSCNPAIGGLAKGHLVREIDALDGLMARAVDEGGIQFRLLNRSKGPAVQGPRAQADRTLYRQAVQRLLRETPGLSIKACAVDDLCFSANGHCQGVATGTGEFLSAGAVVLAAGTFLRGTIHRGAEQWAAGRLGEEAAQKLSLALERRALPLGRLKTGTPARLDGRTIDWNSLERQEGDDPPLPFSFMVERIDRPQIACGITATTPETHALIHANMHRAPLYSGQIRGVGPRYCPSIEDKVVRFADRERHQIFLEPEGYDDPTVYPNGISTSLPCDVQEAIIRSIPGLGKTRILRYGYAIEYDFIDPRALRPSLELRAFPGLFLAGQINGTTGYEEAAAQGLVAGINAAKSAAGEHREDAFVPDRADGYLGVMIDDLVTLGTAEPYRMFTSRAEYRLHLRADNADQRLTDKGIALGVVGAERARRFRIKAEKLHRARTALEGARATPQEWAQVGFNVNQDGNHRSALDMWAYPEAAWERIYALFPRLERFESEIARQLEIEGRYACYLDRQQADIVAFRKEDSLVLPEDLDIAAIGALSNEVRQKLLQSRPATLGAAARIPGVTPAAVTALLRYVKKRRSSRI